MVMQKTLIIDIIKRKLQFHFLNHMPGLYSFLYALELHVISNTTAVQLKFFIVFHQLNENGHKLTGSYPGACEYIFVIR